MDTGDHLRFDAVPIGDYSETPQGFLRVPARLTRVGVLQYRLPDGSIRRELRAPEHVFSKQSLDSMRSAPLTDLHPHQFVTPDNVTELQKGVVSDNIKATKRFVEADIIVQDRELIEAVKRGDRRELSPGYTVKLDMTPGEYNGERYDAIQLDPRTNHVGIGPKDWGRSGPEVSLRLDSSEHSVAYEVVERNDDIHRVVEETPDLGGTTMAQLTLDGVEVEVKDGQEGIVKKILEEKQAKADEVSQNLDSISAERDELREQLQTLQQRLQLFEDPSHIHKLATERNKLESAASRFLQADLSRMTDKEIRLMALKAKHPDIKLDDKSDDYINARFDAMIETVSEDGKSLGEARSVVSQAANTAEVSIAEQARQKWLEHDPFVAPKPAHAH